MTKINCSRVLSTAVALTGALFLSSNALAGVGDIIESNDGMILRFGPGGGTPVTIVPNLDNPKGLVYDGIGHFYVADASRGDITRFNSADGSGGTTFAAGLASPVGLTFDPTGFL